MSTIVQKLISDALFEAEMRTLRANSRIVTPNEYDFATPVQTPVPTPSPNPPLSEYLKTFQNI